jgi:hypothetical protein
MRHPTLVRNFAAFAVHFLLFVLIDGSKTALLVPFFLLLFLSSFVARSDERSRMRLTQNEGMRQRLPRPPLCSPVD